MSDRTREDVVCFENSFSIGDATGIKPAGRYRVVFEDEIIQDLSFLAYRRVSTLLYAPAIGASGPTQVFTVGQDDLDAAMLADGARGKQGSPT